MGGLAWPVNYMASFQVKLGDGLGSFEAGLHNQRDAAATRVVDGAERRRQRIGLLRERGGIARADEPERIASRIDRLSRYHSDVAQ